MMPRDPRIPGLDSMDLCVITPSYVSSHQRAKFAVRSLTSLRHCVGRSYRHIVVDDRPSASVPVPGGSKLDVPIPDPFWWRAAATIYDEPNTELIRRNGGNSVSAVLRGVREAKELGFDLAFLHMDDNVYIPHMGDLVRCARDAFARRGSLRHLHLAGYPLLCNQCSPTEGNRSLVEHEDDRVTVDDIVFRPDRAEDYTLWAAPFGPDMHHENFWPITGWSSVFRIEFLEWLLTRDGVETLPNLGQWEVYYRDPENWKTVVDHGGELGYINMQFGGLEMHHNDNWRELIAYPNEPIR